MARRWMKLLSLAVLFTAVAAKPQCTSKPPNDIVCTAGDDNYVLEKGLVSDQPAVTGITLRACGITQIKIESFKGLPSLEYLDLSQNLLTNLDLGVLDETQNMKFVNLSYNSLKSLPVGIFDQEPSMDILDLRGNNIASIQKGLFAPFRRLRHLDLSNNLLLGREMSPEIFEYNKVIEFMDFSRNDMSGAPDDLMKSFTKINFLNLDNCFLNEVPAFATKGNLRTMKHLLVSSNLITKLDDPRTFFNLENLEILNLAGNSIEIISNNIFKPLKKIKVINLINNKLKTIPDTLFQNLPKLVNLYLQYNSLEFLPLNAFRNSGIKNLNVGGNKITFLPDNFCLELKNSGTNLKKFLFTNNPWQCVCLLELLAEMKRMRIEYNPEHFDGKQKICVTQDHYCHRNLESNSVYVELYENLVRKK